MKQNSIVRNTFNNANATMSFNTLSRFLVFNNAFILLYPLNDSL
jgi:hypothetical protein